MRMITACVQQSRMRLLGALPAVLCYLGCECITKQHNLISASFVIMASARRRYLGMPSAPVLLRIRGTQEASISKQWELRIKSLKLAVNS